MTTKHNSKGNNTVTKIYRNQKRFFNFLKKNEIGKVKQIAIDYSEVWENGNYVSLRFLAEKYGVHESIINDSIAYSIVYGLISMDIAQAIKKKIHNRQAKYSRSNKPNKNDRYYDRLFELRKILQDAPQNLDECNFNDILQKLEILKQQISHLKSQVLDFDSYVSSEDELFFKKSNLENELEKLEKEFSGLEKIITIPKANII